MPVTKHNTHVTTTKPILITTLNIIALDDDNKLKQTPVINAKTAATIPAVSFKNKPVTDIISVK